MLKYFEHGEGIPLFLLHGYLEQKEMWKGIITKTPPGIRVICPDLPGHGKSTTQKGQTIESMGKSVVDLADKLGINKFNIAGHSMGGYVSLAVAEKYPERIISLSLLHSHPFADTDEKKVNRIREAKLLKDDRKKEMIIRMSVPNLFSSDYAEKNPDEVNRTISKALTTTSNGMTACLKAMAERPDRCIVAEKKGSGCLFVLGKKDNLIPYKNVAGRYKGTKVKVAILEEAGHMGMVEETDNFCKYLFDFVKKNKCQ